MKRSFFSILKSRSGETLMEGMISILVFTILLTAVTSIIAASLRITSTATREAAAMQEAVNDVLEGDGENRDDSITFTVNGETITVDITETKKAGFIAFTPR
jgi:Tfp pilus assembly protein PilV